MAEEMQAGQASAFKKPLLPLATTVHVSPVGAVAPLKGTVQSVSAPERTEQKQRDAQARGGTGATIMNSETANGGADDMVLDRVDPAPLKLEQFLPYGKKLI